VERLISLTSIYSWSEACMEFYLHSHNFYLSNTAHLTQHALIVMWPALFQCQKRGLPDYVQLGGSQGLDTTHLVVADSICGMDSKPGQWITQVKFLGFLVFWHIINKNLHKYIVASLRISICNNLRMNFREIWYWGALLEFVDTFQFWLKLGSNGHFMCWSTYIPAPISGAIC
jgi:hypothetical protein